MTTKQIESIIEDLIFVKAGVSAMVQIADDESSVEKLSLLCMDDLDCIIGRIKELKQDAKPN